MRVIIRAPGAGDERAFLEAVGRSVRLHRPWVYPPSSQRAFRVWLERSRDATHRSYLARLRSTGELTGVINVSEIVRGQFRSAYLGYYAFEPHAGRGYMAEAMRLVIGRAFGSLRLHRLEANIQPGNLASIAMVRRLGFRREGYSPRYLKIGGRWRDHERWAILSEEWGKRRTGKARRGRQVT